MRLTPQNTSETEPEHEPREAAGSACPNPRATGGCLPWLMLTVRGDKNYVPHRGHRNRPAGGTGRRGVGMVAALTGE
jgi:hypothetical protein